MLLPEQFVDDAARLLLVAGVGSLQIEACAESPADPHEDDGTALFLGGELIENRVEAGQRFAGQGIQPVGPVE